MVAAYRLKQLPSGSIAQGFVKPAFNRFLDSSKEPVDGRVTRAMEYIPKPGLEAPIQLLPLLALMMVEVTPLVLGKIY
jgi:hypothetical protein